MLLKNIIIWKFFKIIKDKISVMVNYIYNKKNELRKKREERGGLDEIIFFSREYFIGYNFNFIWFICNLERIWY